MRRWTFAGAAVLLVGCASGYSQFYAPISTPPGAILPFSGQPTVVSSTGDPLKDVNEMYAQGYGAIGSASFNGRDEGAAGALAQAKKVGASHVIVDERYARTISGAIPITTMQTRYATTNGTVTATGTGGYATGTYTGTTTYQTPQTTYIPYSVDRYDQRAIFFAPIRRHGFGIRAFPTTPEQAVALGTNHGLLVQAVRRGSPAFAADVLPGDLILTADGEPVDTGEALVAKLQAGASVLGIRRGGQMVTAKVKISPDLNW